MAFMYLWQRATKLNTLRISGNIVVCSVEDPTLYNEQTFCVIFCAAMSERELDERIQKGNFLRNQKFWYKRI